jgi:two-component system, chemotaxis family, protein-glutamate methylesterase/glutaminase
MRASGMENVLRVVVVDDSAYVRKVVKEMLSRSPFLEVVGMARDGAEALELVAALEPDVVTCDLLMPTVGGIEFVRAQMARRPVPIVIVSSIDGHAHDVLSALDAGAVDFVQKPSAFATERMLDIAVELVAKVKAAGSAPRARLAPTPAASIPPLVVPAAGPHRVDVVVLGISTGGPQALRDLIPRFPATWPVPIVMVLHMPIGYTEAYASKLNEISPLEVFEVKQGHELRAGVVWLAPAGRHLTLRRHGARVCAHLDVQPAGLAHRPSVDVLFRSAGDVFGARTLGVVMTGMGHDGREGAAWIKAKGGTVITEAEETCIVYGMPRSVVEAGLSDAAVPLGGMATAIIERI